jgi:hypothetical protein
MTTIHGVSNIKDIGLLTFNNEIIYIDAQTFKNYCTTVFNANDNESNLDCDDDGYTAINSYFIANNNDRTKTEGAISSLVESSKNLKNILKDGIEFNINSGASHNNSKGSKVNFNNKQCTQFHKLRNMNDNIIINKKFNKFSGLKHWLSYFRSGTYDWYWRVYYRTVDDYYKYYNCSDDNLDLSNYINNKNDCKKYIDNDNKHQWIANTCVRDTVSENDLFGICNNQLLLNNIRNDSKKDIIKKQAEFCKKGTNLITNQNCHKFWGVGKDSYNDYYTKSDKFNFFEKDDWIKKNLCKNGHNNYPFCNCINNEKNKVSYKDSNGKTQYVEDICLRDHCNEQAYRPSGYDEYTCPPICIQNMEVKYGTLTDAKQSCAIDISNKKNQTNIPEPSNNMLSEEDKDILNKDQNKIKSSLFNWQNDNIKSFMKQLNVNTIETSSYLLNEEDIFILGIIFIFIFIIIIKSSFKQKDEPYQYSQQPYYQQPYYPQPYYQQQQYGQPYNYQS